MTRYRQIVETESSERLTLEEQHYITEDQKHSSQVAKIHYKKKQSRVVAIEGKKCMDKMTSRSERNENLLRMFNNIDLSFDNEVLKKSQQLFLTLLQLAQRKPNQWKFLQVGVTPINL